jgi:hypothetical protein
MRCSTLFDVNAANIWTSYHDELSFFVVQQRCRPCLEPCWCQQTGIGYESFDGFKQVARPRALQVNLDLITKPSLTSTLWFRTACGNFATDPRNLVYGMLNVLPKNLIHVLDVDYSDTYTYRDVMVDFAVANIESNQTLS